MLERILVTSSILSILGTVRYSRSMNGNGTRDSVPVRRSGRGSDDAEARAYTRPRTVSTPPSSMMNSLVSSRDPAKSAYPGLPHERKSFLRSTIRMLPLQADPSSDLDMDRSYRGWARTGEMEASRSRVSSMLPTSRPSSSALQPCRTSSFRCVSRALDRKGGECSLRRSGSRRTCRRRGSRTRVRDSES